MIYSDAEIRRWWDSMTTEDQGALFARILDKAFAPGFLVSIQAARASWMEHDQEPDVWTLHQMRRWDR